jgi:hypothetical protein
MCSIHEIKVLLTTRRIFCLWNYRNSNRLCYRVEYVWYSEVPVVALISIVPAYSGQWMAALVAALHGLSLIYNTKLDSEPCLVYPTTANIVTITERYKD